MNSFTMHKDTEDFQIFATPLKAQSEKRGPLRHFQTFTNVTGDQH